MYQIFIYNLCVRAGVGSILKGVDEAVLHMHTGEKLHLVFGGELAFGTKGRPSSPGKPRIPPNAIVDYEVQNVLFFLLKLVSPY